MSAAVDSVTSAVFSVSEPVSDTLTVVTLGVDVASDVSAMSLVEDWFLR